MKVIQLLEHCKKQVAKGNGEKTIYISSDDEGNEFHELFYSFTDNKEEVEEVIKYSNTDKYDIEKHHKLEDIILLG